MIPAQSLRHFGIACLLGVGLGILYGFLRPLRGRLTPLADLVFVVAAFWAWLQLCFGVCRGDIRLGCCMGLPAGIFCWELTVGLFGIFIYDL